MANAPGEKFRGRSDHRAYERAPVGCEPQKLLAPRSRALDNLDHLVRWTRGVANDLGDIRSEEHTSELQSLMRISYAVFCLKKKNIYYKTTKLHQIILLFIIIIK